jgi:hypothetical protein
MPLSSEAVNDRRGHASVPVAARASALLAAGVLALGLAACQTTPSTSATYQPITAAPVTPAPSPTSAPSVAPATVAPTTAATPAPTSVAGAPACTAADLKASHGITDGAAGSLFTEVLLVSNAACSIDAFPALGLRDSTGTAILGGASGGPGRIELTPGVPYTSNVRVSNWCAEEPSFPLELELIVGSEEVAVTGGSFPEDGVPPCNGEGGPILEGSEWVAGPVIL